RRAGSSGLQGSGSVWLPDQPPAAPGAGALLAALLDVGPHEVLGVVLEHLVDLVQQIVQLRLQLLALLRRGRGGLLDDLLFPGGRRLLLLLSLCHGGSGASYEPSRSSSSAGLEHASNNVSTIAAVPLSGSIIGTRRRGSVPRSNTSES